MLIGKAGGAWLEEQNELINFMFDEGMAPDEIAKHLKRSKGSVVGRLAKANSATSERWLTLDRRKRGVRYSVFGKEALRRTMETSRAAFGSFRRGSKNSAQLFET